jgi:hypothetical protein
MKKFIAGLICGIGLSTTTAIYASETIQAFLFPVEYRFNGEARQLSSEYTTLNYNGYAYVPLRFVAENMGAKVGYDGGNRVISVLLPEHQQIITDEQNQLHVGNISLEQTATGTLVKGQLLLDDELAAGRLQAEEFFLAYFTLTFFDGDGKQVSSVDQLMHYGKARLNPGEVHSFEGIASHSFSSFSSVKLEVKYLEKAVAEPPHMTASADGVVIPVVPGSYCWGRCVDKATGAELVRHQIPVQVRPGATIDIHFDTDLLYQEINAVRISGETEATEEVYNQKLVVPREAGIYIYELHTHWFLTENGPRIGDPVYAFVVEVSEELSSSTKAVVAETTAAREVRRKQGSR